MTTIGGGSVPRICAWFGPAAAAMALAACSSTTTELDAAVPPTTDASSDARADAASAAAAECREEKARVAEGPEGTCCDGLVKACVPARMADRSPCICSKVACVDARATPPKNVPCCSTESTNCVINLQTGDVQCTCE